MIVTCASCLTKFSLDESRLPAQGAKVRCSRCQHVFHVVPPITTEEEEIVEDFESFAKSHEDVIEPGLKTSGTSSHQVEGERGGSSRTGRESAPGGGSRETA